MQSSTHHLSVFGSKVTYWIFNPSKKQTIFMVHGFRGTHHGLQTIIDNLSDFRIVIPDLPGFGDSTPMTERVHDIAGYSEFVEYMIQKLDLAHCVLLGHSFGSIIASEVAARSQIPIQKLILINPIATPALQGPRKLFTQFAIAYYWLGRKLPKKVGEALLKNKSVTLSTSALLAKTKDKNLRKRIHKAHLTHFSRFQTRETLNEAFMASVSATAADHAAAITMPTLLIVGEIDDVAPLKGQRKLARSIPQATLIEIAKVGHLIHHEAPEQAAAAMTQFLR
jgi:pimeloyl-ACP methyl ester carboxylesterase